VMLNRALPSHSEIVVMGEEPAICVIGAANMDLISYVPRLPRMGETLHGHEFHMGFGGKGANQAVMAARLGARVSIVTKLGEDVFGDKALENFREQGIDTTYVSSTREAFSGVAPIAVDRSGNNSIIIVTGANDLLTPEDVEAAEPAIRSARVVACQLEIEVETTLAALRLARGHGVTTIFNPAPARPELDVELYELSDVFCPNESEAEMLTGETVASVEDAERAARAMLSRGAQAVVLTLGDNGCLVVTPEEARHVAVDQVTALDTTGAGDAFVGSLAFFLARGQSLAEAARRANSVAAVSVQAHGTQASFPAAADLPQDVLG
jgi:ribokinase